MRLLPQPLAYPQGEAQLQAAARAHAKEENFSPRRKRLCELLQVPIADPGRLPLRGYLVAEMIARRNLLLSVAMFAFATSALADPPPGKGKNKHQHGGENETAARLAGAAVFTAAEVQYIRGYYQSRATGGKPLPPGIAKNLARGKPLPPGIAKRYAPPDLVRGLSSRSGYEVLVAGASILLVEVASGVIRDIVENAIAR